MSLHSLSVIAVWFHFSLGEITGDIAGARPQISYVQACEVAAPRHVDQLSRIP